MEWMRTEDERIEIAEPRSGIPSIHSHARDATVMMSAC
jgi:hypothetical protein